MDCVGARERVALISAVPVKVSAPLLVLLPLGGGDPVRPSEGAAELEEIGELEEEAGSVKEGEVEAAALPDAAKMLLERCGDNEGFAKDAVTDGVGGGDSEANVDEEGYSGEGVCSRVVRGDWEAEGAPGVDVGAPGVPLCGGDAEAQAVALPEPQKEGGAVKSGVADGFRDGESTGVRKADPDTRAEAPLPKGKDAVAMGVAGVPAPVELPASDCWAVAVAQNGAVGVGAPLWHADTDAAEVAVEERVRLPTPLADSSALQLPLPVRDPGAREGVRVFPPGTAGEGDTVAVAPAGETVPPGARAEAVKETPRRVRVALGVALGVPVAPLAEVEGAPREPVPGAVAVGV